ncbi:MAG: phosphoribosylaminoimidazolesuccinocarboxamide synthase [Planctomycetota bacterium]|jgi:phosphoribosylaminoimidazole-succinocarboxamide synthase|nr:phosphoribosylaminoimidazolesuccinocarboxamide synthase [Planctomycetota bacterium]
MTSAVLQSNCPDLDLITRGKVRDLYRIDAEHLLFVASDRISAFDVIMDTPIPGKGKILTQLSLFWFDLLSPVSPNHLVTADINEMPAAVQKYADQLAGRSMLVRQLEILPVEAIVRGYITGSGWKEYRKQGTVCDIPLPEGLQESAKLAAPLYTPSTKAELGAHDENIHPDKAAEIIGAERAAAVSDKSIALYSAARDYAAERGIIIADTKFEFGVDASGAVVLADEVLTPDSSRFWPADSYGVGRGQDSFDKQYLRDYLESIGFDKTNPVELPDEVVANTQAKYAEAYTILTGQSPEL